ncbi:MAG TPA: ATP-binding protein [Terriglobales bacterium]|nr:ATP-binding protein [Terriglobales bacterium]
MACAAVLVGGGVFYAVKIYFPAADLREQNRRTLDKVPCIDKVCNITELANDYEFVGADYLVDKNNRFLLSFESPEGLHWRLNRSDSSFVLRFISPEKFDSPAGETWRLVSTEKQIGKRRVAILVGYAVKVSWRMYFPIADFTAVDSQLKEQLAKIADVVRENNGVLEVPTRAVVKLPMDGYEVVDEQTNAILAGGYWLPVFLPADVTYPSDGTSFLLGDGKLYMTITTENERLIAVSTYLIGEWPSLMAVFALLFLLAGLFAYLAATTVLRRHLLFSQTTPANVADALQKGEGPSVEFKRSISFEVPNSVYQLLQTVAAFANTGDGSVFVGVEDDGKVKGVPLENQKARDSLSHRLYHAIRERIRPTPSVRIDFIEAAEHTVCRIFVPRGDDPLYFLDGVIYVRHGSADVKAQPELVRRILEEFAS